MVRDWDGEELVVRQDAPTGSWIFVAIHSTVLGPAAGGTRFKRYSDMDAALADVLRLSKGMTYKFATPGLPFGGGKAVIMAGDGLDADGRNGLLGRFGSLIGSLGGRFFTGPDVGTSPEDMDVIASTGAPYVFCRTPEAGGAGDPGPYTALGVFTAIQSVAARRYGTDDLAGRRVAVQGAGDVGGPLIDRLLAAGADLVFSEVSQPLIERFAAEGVPFVGPEEIYGVACDIFAPCALGGVLNEPTIAQLQCAAIAGSANNQLATVDDAQRLQARGILYAPDYVANVGGAMAMPSIESLGRSPEQAHDDVVEFVGRALNTIFDTADRDGITTAAAAQRLANANLAAGRRPA